MDGPLETLTSILMDAKSMRTTEKVVFNSHLDDPEIFDLRCLPKRYHRIRADKPEAFGGDGREKLGIQISIAQKDKAARP
jgi:hypothetical protein